MHASPSIQEIASALAQIPKAPAQRSFEPSRILCLKLHEAPNTGSTRPAKPFVMRAVVEAFLKYSPRVHWRPADARANERAIVRNGNERRDSSAIAADAFCWVFIDIASTSHLYHGEERLMHSAQSLARDLGFGVQCAVADTPSGAQAFATAHHGTIVPPGEERERLKSLSLPLLLHLEGLSGWGKPSAIESMITFFMMLGFKTAGDLSRFTMSSLHERWGETGALLWRRLNAQDRQVVSPLLPTEPLQDYVHLDFPISLVSLLLHQMQKSVEFLFARLQGRRYFARQLVLTLHCEFSSEQHKVVIEPNTPSRDRDLFLTLMENRLGELNLLNPIRDFEIHVVPCPEKTQQLDFFEPRVADDNKLQSLFSLVTQASIKPGFYRIEPAVLPEKSWRLAASGEATATAEPVHHVAHANAVDHLTYGTSALAIAPQPYYGAAVMRAPRPTRLLKEPLPLSLDELGRLKVLSSNPLERLENGWWESGGARPRDYYFAVSPEGQCLWIFQDVKTEEYFLHGYFD